MAVIAVWVKQEQRCVLSEEHSERFEEMVREFGPPDGTFMDDWILPIYTTLMGVDKTNMKAIVEDTLATVDRMTKPPTCPHCGNHPYNCMGDDD